MQPTVQTVTVVPQFDPQASRYRCCCCGCCRVTTCALVIGTLELIGIIIHLIAGIYTYTTNTTLHRGDLISCIVVFAIWLPIVVMLFYGVTKQIAGFLIPHLVFQIIAMIGLVAGMIIFGLAAGAATTTVIALSDNGNGRDTATVVTSVSLGAIIAGLIGFAITFFLQILFLVNIWRCYQYLKDKAIFERLGTLAPPPAPIQNQFPADQPMNGYSAYPNQGYPGDNGKGQV